MEHTIPYIYINVQVLFTPFPIFIIKKEVFWWRASGRMRHYLGKLNSSFKFSWKMNYDQRSYSLVGLNRMREILWTYYPRANWPCWCLPSVPNTWHMNTRWLQMVGFLWTAFTQVLRIWFLKIISERYSGSLISIDPKIRMWLHRTVPLSMLMKLESL